MEFCLICKEFADKRFRIEVYDSLSKQKISGYLCVFCWENFIASHNNKGRFKISQLRTWLKRKIRIF